MKIGFFTDSYFPEIDGVTYTLKTWKERLEERGHEVFVIYPNNSNYRSGENEIAVKSIPNPFYSGYNIPIPLGYGKIPDDLDIVHCHGPGPVGRLGKRYAGKKDIPRVYTHHTPIEEYLEQGLKSKILASVISKIYMPIENRFLSRFDKVTASTRSVERNVEVTKLPVGIDMDFFKFKENSIIEELDLRRPIIGYSGRISMEKNVEEICKLGEQFDGSIVIIGEGPQREKVEEMAGDNVAVRDFLPREELPGFYSGIDVFVTASNGDTLGLSTLEANSCGTPVVAADVKPFNKTIKSENGLRFNLGDIQDMKYKVHEAIESKYDTRKAVKKYSIDETIEQLQTLYEEELENYGI